MKYAVLTSVLILMGMVTCFIASGNFGRQAGASDGPSRLKVYSVEKGKYVMTEKVGEGYRTGFFRQVLE